MNYNNKSKCSNITEHSHAYSYIKCMFPNKLTCEHCKNPHKIYDHSGYFYFKCETCNLLNYIERDPHVSFNMPRFLHFQ